MFVKDFVEFMVTGKKVTGGVHDFICFEEKMGVFVTIEALEQYPNQCGSWIISGMQCVPVNAILCVLIWRNGPYIGGHLAFFFKLNFKHVYNLL